MMRALLINGSPHARGCTFTALSIVGRQLEQAGIKAEVIHVGHKAIRGCIGCFKCRELGHCVFNDDIVNEVAIKLEEAHAVVLGSPVYFAGINGTLKAFLDRLFFSTQFSKRFKVGAAVVSARRAGTTATIDQLNKYFLHGEMPVASSRYWNIVHGNTPDEVLKDEEGLQTMRVLGRNIAFLVHAIDAERNRNGLPQVEPQRIATNFIR